MQRSRWMVYLTLLGLAAGWLGWRFVLAPAVQAQQPDVATLKAEARLVLVDTVVTDKHGNYVHDLTAKDFKVWEDNKEQAIKSFSYESAGTPSANPERHYLVLFFDDSSMEFGDQAKAREAAAKFIDNNAGPNRVMAVVEFGGTLRITQNFTANADRLKQAVGGVKGSAVASNPSPADNPPGSIAAPPAGVQVASLATPGMGIPNLGNVESNFGARSVLLALRDLAKDLAAVPGRKTLVMLTSGFPLNPELQSELTATIDACNKNNVAVYPIDVRGLVAPGGAATGRLLLLPGSSPLGYAELLNPTYADFGGETGEGQLVFVQHTGAPSGAGGGSHSGAPGGTATGSPGVSGGSHSGSPASSGVASHGGPASYGASNYYNSTFQPNQLIPPIPPSATDNQQVLYALASGTGGFVILNTNDLLGGMEKIAKEQNEYYLLGYTPTDTPEGSCHVLRVKVDRGGTEVRSRSGYCNVKPADLLASKPIEKQLENQASAAQSGTSGVAIQTPYFYTSANTARVNLAMEIAASAFKFEKVKGKQHATLNILGIAYKVADNSVAARFSDAVDVDLDGKKEMEAFSKQAFHYENQFDVASGEYNLKIAFNSGGDAFGKIETSLKVDPYDGTRFSLSSMALSKDLHRAADMATSLDAALMEDHTPLIAHGMQIVPAANYSFKKTDTAALYAEIYAPLLASASPPQVAMEMKVFDRKTGQAKFDTGLMGAASFIQKGNPVVPVGLKIPVNTLDPGSYRVQLEALDSLGNKSALRTADFEVE